ncbi:MAG: lysylphosphatidylglycerol synthase transmembrane domain-containing protein [Streptosporangiaceae bacterium]
MRTRTAPPAGSPAPQPARAARTGRDRDVQQSATARPRPGRRILRATMSAALIVAAFGFALPRVASYRSVWASLDALSWPHAAEVGAAAVASMAAYWITIRAVLPWIRMRQAAAVSLGSNAVANALPAGGALAMGVSWAMLSSWGLSTGGYVLYTLVTGVWNVFGLLGLPVLALAVMTTAGRPDAVLISAAAVGLALLIGMACGLGLLLRSQAFTLRVGHALQPALVIAARLARRPPPAQAAGSLSRFRDQAGALLTARGGRITAATVASHLTLWLVLLTCLRAVGLSQTQVPWQTSLAAFAFVRLLTALPITPGGLGITELGLVGILATSADHKVTVQVTAAVLLYRAVTYLPSIPLGAAACLIWRHAPMLLGSSRLTPLRTAQGAVAVPDRPRQTSPPGQAVTHDGLGHVPASTGG